MSLDLSASSAPAHRALNIQQWLKSNIPGFIAVDDWLSGSPDLNQLDYSLCACCYQWCSIAESFEVLCEKRWKKVTISNEILCIAPLVHTLFHKFNFIKKCIIISFLYRPELVTGLMAGPCMYSGFLKLSSNSLKCSKLINLNFFLYNLIFI